MFCERPLKTGYDLAMNGGLSQIIIDVSVRSGLSVIEIKLILMFIGMIL